MPDARDKLMFIPVSGGGGGGELQRSLILARAVRTRWPSLPLRFVVHRDAPFPREEFDTVDLEASPTRCEAVVNAAIREFRPSLTVFDSSLRMSALQTARAMGSRTIYLSVRPNSRWRGLDPRKRDLLDEHWLLVAGRQGRPPWRERLGKALLPRTRFEYMGVVFEAPDVGAATALLQHHGLHPGQYVVVCPGGSGYRIDGLNPLQLLAAAWRKTEAARGVPVLAIGADASAWPDDWIAIETLPNRILMGLVQASRLNLVNGGSLLVQALALGTANLAIPMQEEQAQRIAGFQSRDALLTAPAQVDAISTVLQLALSDEARVRTVRDNARALHIDNDLPRMLDRIATYLAG